MSAFGDLFANSIQLQQLLVLVLFCDFVTPAYQTRPAASLLSSDQIVISRLLVRARDYCLIISWVIKESSIIPLEIKLVITG